MKMTNWLGAIILLAVCLLQPAVGSAVTLGQIDDFQDGTTKNWSIGGAVPTEALPVNVPTGGPAGDGDAYLRLTALGNGSPNVGSRLSVFNNAQWTGNYLAAGVNTITMSVNNLGTTDLSLRLVLANFPVPGFPPDLLAMSTVPVFLPAGSGWTSVVFPLDPSRLTALVGTVQAALTQPGELRIIHNPNPTFPPPVVVAQLGVDNIKALRQGPLPYLPLLLLDD